MLSAMKGDGSYQTFKTSQSGLRSNVHNKVFVFAVSIFKMWPINPLSPDVKIHILLTVLHTFLIWN